MAVNDKKDIGKTRWDVLPWRQIDQIAQVMTYGANKYGDTNWNQIENGVERYFAAAMRHITAWRLGEYVDEESNLPHLAHAMCSLMLVKDLCEKAMRDSTAQQFLDEYNSDHRAEPSSE
jgi:hypothetical protein